MATRTALGSAATKSTTTSWTALSSITLAVGDTLLVGVTSPSDVSGQLITGVSWNGTALTQRAGVTTGTGIHAGIWVLESSEHSGGTGNIVATYGADVRSALVATKYDGLASSSFDQGQGTQNGTTTAPDSGDTSTTTQNDEVLWGVHGADQTQSGSYGSIAAGSDCTAFGQHAETTGGGGPSTRVEITETFGTQTSTGARNSALTGAESAPWSSSIVTLKVQAGETVAPGSGSASLTGFAASLVVAAALTLGAGAATLTGQAPTAQVATDHTIAAASGSATLAGSAPTLTLHQARAPGSGTLTLSGQTPLVTSARTIPAASGSLTLAGSAPTSSTGFNPTPDTGTLTLAGAVPAVTTQRTLSPGSGSLALTGQAPAALIGRTAAPGAGALTLSGAAPTLTATRAANPTAGSATLTGLAPAATVQRQITAAAGSLTLTGLAPTVSQSADQTVTPGSGALALTGQAPTITIARAVTAGSGTLTIAGGAPTISGAQSVTLGSGSLIVTGVAPAVVLDRLVTFGSGTLTLTGYAPAVTGVTDHVVTPGSGSLMVTGYAPAVLVPVDHAITTIAGALSLSGSTPAATIATTVSPGTGALAFTGYAPDVAPIVIYPTFSTTTQAIRRVRRAPILSTAGMVNFHRFIQISLQTGVGLTTGQGADPVLFLRYSDDGGHTWSELQTLSVGAIGKRTTRVFRRHLGRARNRVYEISTSDPVAYNLVAAYLDAERGTS